ncbi:MAG TPA: hypothetical protein VFQ61_16940 [Polyangiaceae bacterium]|nr:hypothetical protein [Polyangiaceae bacterium]
MTASRQGSPNALERAVESVGEAWAQDFAQSLKKEGRAVAGGWPGTLSEARARVVACAAGRLGPNYSIVPEQLEALTRRAYEVAKKAWLASSEPDRDEQREDARFDTLENSERPPRAAGRARARGGAAARVQATSVQGVGLGAAEATAQVAAVLPPPPESMPEPLQQATPEDP